MAPVSNDDATMITMASSSAHDNDRLPSPSRRAQVPAPPSPPAPSTTLEGTSLPALGPILSLHPIEEDEGSPVDPSQNQFKTTAAAGSVDLPLSPSLPPPTVSFLDPAGTSMDSPPIAPTPNPVASTRQSFLYHTASTSSVRGHSDSEQLLHSAPPQSFFPPADAGQPLKPAPAFSPPYPLQHAPSRQVSFYATADLSRRPSAVSAAAGPTGAGGGPEWTSVRHMRGPSISARAASRQQSIASRLGKAEEDGDLADWKRLWLHCKSLPRRCFNALHPLTRRVYREVAAPWQRRFSDVEEQRRWWGCNNGGGQQRPSPQGQTLDDRLESIRQRQQGQGGEGGSSSSSSGGGGSVHHLRGMSADELRSDYVLGRLPSVALTLEQQTGAASEDVEAAADLLRKEDFIMKLCVTMHRHGCPIPRNEYSMQMLLEALGVQGSFTVLPSIIFVSFGAPISCQSETHILRVGGGLDCYKLRRINHLVNMILDRKIESLTQAIAKLDSIIDEAPLYSWPVTLACYALSSGLVAPLFFKGSLVDGALSGLIGLCVAGPLWVLSDSSYVLGKVSLVLTATLSSFFATVMSQNIGGTCPLAVHFGPITYLLPGWSITVSVIELSTQNVLSGTVRLMGSLMSAVLLGFGLDFGSRLAFWERPESWISTNACHPVGVWMKVPLFLGTLVCFCILLKAAPAQWPGMLTLAALSYCTINLAFDRGMDASSATVLTSFIIGVAGNLYSYATNSPALIPMLVGIFMLVPGGMSVKGVHALVNTDQDGSMTGGVVWSNVMVVATSISVGLFAASVLLYKPRVKISNTVFF